MRTAEQGLDVAEIAKRVRAEIKQKVKTGELPCAKYSVTISRYSGGRSLNVRISDVVLPVTDFSRPGVVPSVLALERVQANRKDPREYLPEVHYPTFTDEGKAVLAMVNALIDPFHWDESDAMTDYFHCNFYRSVNFDWQWLNVEADRIWCPEAVEVAV